ncbi:MAG: hypothetical protein ACSW8D_03765 [Prevotella sp.]|jgi:hypothetical protein
MKKHILTMLCLLLTAPASAALGNANVLITDSMVIVGNCLAQMKQQVEVNVRNTSGADVEAHLFLLACHQVDHSLTQCLDTLVTIKARSSRDLLLYPCLPEGDLELRLTCDAAGQQVIGTCEVCILPLRKLDFKATFSLDMLAMVDGEQVLYGSRMRGWGRVENHDGPYLGAGDGSDNDGIVLWIEREDTGERVYTQRMASKLSNYGSISTSFSYDAAFHDGASYKLKAGYGMPYGLQAIDSLCFTTRCGTNTYWTADGRVLPLPEKNQLLLVPAEAVAVDLRGQYLINTIFSVDASEANPNCLYYLDPIDNVPQGLDESRNIVRGQEASHVKLVDGYDYYCPLAFHSQFVSYRMTPSYNHPDDELCGRGYSETLVLPFHPDHINLCDVNGETDMLHADLLKVLRYYGNAGDSLNVVELNSLSQMQAYVPYILGVYIGSQLLFVGENTLVPMTREAIVRGQGIDFVGTTVARQLLMPTYQYHSDDYHFYLSTACVAPFRAYMVGGQSLEPAGWLSFSDEVWGTQGKPNDATAISGLPTRAYAPARQPVYSVSGQQWGTLHMKGIYIIGGRKMVVK